MKKFYWGQMVIEVALPWERPEALHYVETKVSAIIYIQNFLQQITIYSFYLFFFQ